MDNINQAIKSIESEMNVLLERVEALQKAKDALKALYKTPEQEYPLRYRVESRSGGNPHEIWSLNGKYGCSCPAGIAGRECWALRGVRSVSHLFNPAANGNFSDETGIKRHYEYLGRF